MPYRLAVRERPASRQIHQLQHRLHFGMRIAVGLLQLGLVGFRITFLGVSIGLKDGNNV